MDSTLVSTPVNTLVTTPVNNLVNRRASLNFKGNASESLKLEAYDENPAIESLQWNAYNEPYDVNPAMPTMECTQAT